MICNNKLHKGKIYNECNVNIYVKLVKFDSSIYIKYKVNAKYTMAMMISQSLRVLSLYCHQ